MQIFIKNLTFILCAIYYFIKLLNFSCSRKNIFFYSIFAIILSLISTLTELYIPHITIPLIVILSIPFLSYCLSVLYHVSIPTAIMAYGISYTFFALSTTITSVIFVMIFPSRDNNHIMMQLVISLIMIIMMPLPFQVKRLKSGMPFLKNKENSILGVVICLTILFAGILLSNNNYSTKYITFFVIIYICTILVYIYWRVNLHKAYLDKLHQRNLSDLNILLSEKQLYIEQLEKENKRLSKIIHKDNKLIPAMEYAVKCYLNISPCHSMDIKNTGNRLLSDLTQLSNERKNIIEFQELQFHKPVSIKIESTDRLLQYMQQRAIQNNITLDVIVSCEISCLTKQIIKEDDLNTILADLIENAMIAVKYNKQHNILVNVSIVSNCYSINIFDNGIPFTREVLLQLGLQQITTHADDSGSGIGLITTYNLLQKYNASLIINEISNNGQYTKEISILFNGINQYILKTGRDKEDIAYLQKRTDLQIIQK